MIRLMSTSIPKFNMREKKSLITIIIIAIIIISIFIILITMLSKIIKNKDVYHEDAPMSEDISKKEQFQGKFQKLENISDFYTVRACLSKFLNSYYSLYEYNTDLERSNLIDLLDSSYISYKNITEDNVYYKLEEYKQSILTINKILSLNNYNGIYVYFVNYTVRNSLTNENTDSKIILILDRNSMTYSVLLEDYLKYKNLDDIKVGETINFDIPNKIEKNNNNYFGYLSFSYDQYAEDLYEQFRSDLIYNVDRAYKLLDEEFKNDNYPTIDSFKEFIKDNYKNIYISKYGTYSNIIDNDNVKYKCIDSSGKFYVTFSLVSPMEYTYIFEVK